jgi:hypothetical protein
MVSGMCRSLLFFFFHLGGQKYTLEKIRGLMKDRLVELHSSDYNAQDQPIPQVPNYQDLLLQLEGEVMPEEPPPPFAPPPQPLNQVQDKGKEEME